EHRAAALCAARSGSDHGIAEAVVHIVDEEPGAPVGHVERSASLRDRSGLADCFEEPDLARAERPVRTKIDAHRQPNSAHRAPRTGGDRQASTKPGVLPKRCGRYQAKAAPAGTAVSIGTAASAASRQVRLDVRSGR